MAAPQDRADLVALHDVVARLRSVVEAQHQASRATLLVLAGVIMAFVTPTIWDVSYVVRQDVVTYYLLLLLAPLALAATAVRVSPFKAATIVAWVLYAVLGLTRGSYTGSDGWFLLGATIITITGLLLIPVRATEDGAERIAS